MISIVNCSCYRVENERDSSPTITNNSFHLHLAEYKSSTNRMNRIDRIKEPETIFDSLQTQSPAAMSTNTGTSSYIGAGSIVGLFVFIGVPRLI
jgi:hypothetical protein